MAHQPRPRDIDPIERQVFGHLLAAIPEEMGIALRQAAFSPNIKERLDFSCALTGPDGGMAAQASHIPVHLGSTHVTARFVMSALALEPGDVVLLNDPYAGGTHLPDVTVFAPVFFKGRKAPAMGVLARAHHADVGGATPGSMGPAIDLFGEGVVIPPVRLYRKGRLVDDVRAIFLANSRTPDERAGDLAAQASAVRLGVARVEALAKEHGPKRLLLAVAALREHAARATRAMIRGLRDGVFRAEDTLDGPGTPRLLVTVTKKGSRLRVDFTGTSAEVKAPFNANEAITLSCVFYAVRLFLGRDLLTNSGCLDPIEVVIPEGSLLGARRPAAVAAGNVETSQRIVDLLLAALGPAATGRVPSASQGTMNNVTVGGRKGDGSPWTFYETIAGGAGAGPRGPGTSGIHTHMTNTLNTPIEAIENAFPVRVTAYQLREDSGGRGRHRGGDGVIREFEFEGEVLATVMATRRRSRPPGSVKGQAGSAGKDSVTKGGHQHRLAPNSSMELGSGDRLRIETPGGAGWSPEPARRIRRLGEKSEPRRRR